MTNQPRPGSDESQSNKFREAARELGAYEDEARFDAPLKKVASAPPPPKGEPKAKPKKRSSVSSGLIHMQENAMKFAPIEGDSGATFYDLRREPDGIYRVYRRAVPCADDAALRVDDRQFVATVHRHHDDTVGLLG